MQGGLALKADEVSLFVLFDLKDKAGDNLCHIIINKSHEQTKTNNWFY